MPNWCFATYVIEGDKKEIDKVESMMNRLMNMKEPVVKNNFGTNWLGCIVHQLGGNWRKVRCRGTWDDLERLNERSIKFTTETAWAPCNETFDILLKHYPTLRYFYSSQEPNMNEYWTNDLEKVYFPERFIIDLCTPQEQYNWEYFKTLESTLEWVRENFGEKVRCEEDIETLCERWQTESEHAFINLHKYKEDWN